MNTSENLIEDNESIFKRPNELAEENDRLNDLLLRSKS